MAGKLYGIGVSIGDPEQLTLKAARIIRECDVIAVPQSSRENSVAWNNTKTVVPELAEKETICFDFPMTKDRKVLQKAHDKAAMSIKETLENGKNIGFLIIGDPCIYSTYMYIHKQIAARGFDTEIVNGITSFCASGSALNISLCEEDEELHIIPSSYGVDDALKYKGVKVFMKSGRKLPKIIEKINGVSKEKNLEIYMVENCGLPNEKTYKSLEEINRKDLEEISYFTIIIAKEKK